ncbi:FAD-binding domain-containing protein [uncultured Sulfitobacter sp.]|uniref:FAD-binding domain-containing protein n=1 Tax=uncultured Sulfitobacter sp. TaxID=191468 RepID=UPI0026091468|nr:FAD-binding domain-containing protein [uncultured Sulfitobacter sp.]
MKTKDIIRDLAKKSECPDFTPSRTAGLARLDLFAERAGGMCDRCRNYDLGPEQRTNVSALSPWIRHRLISETEVLHAVLERHTFETAERFVHEVFWRTYFKGWLEQHPSAWAYYQTGLRSQLNSLDKDRRLAANYADAVDAQTGIDCFDSWAEELVNTGYLHNHARMWFASIWIFTLRLPWELGADFFLRHLMDGDPASNTLAWRWVGGLQTKGRPYIARVSNISKFTDGRYSPLHQLNTDVTTLTEDAEHQRVVLPQAIRADDVTGDYLLLITEEDMQIADTLPHPSVVTLGALATEARSPLPLGKIARGFARDAMRNTCAGAQIIETDAWADALISACKTAGVKTIVTSYAPVGPVASALSSASPDLHAAGITLYQVRRAFDTTAWPHATKGFFKMKKEIPSLLKQLKIVT